MSEEVIAAYGAGQGSLLQPVLERVAEYLVPHSYTLVGTTTRVPLHGKTSKALHTEIMAIGAPFDLVLTDLDEEEISDDFLEKCKHLVSILIHAPKVTKIGSLFLGDCTSLSCFDTSGLTSVTTIGEGFLASCLGLQSLNSTGLTSVKTIGGAFLVRCTALSSFDTSGLTSVTSIGRPFLLACTSLPKDALTIKNEILHQKIYKIPTLFYTTTSCAAASYIAATIGSITFDHETVDLYHEPTRTASGNDFGSINWAGTVPTLVLPNGAVLNENVATLTWISDNAVTKWGPAPGSPAHYEMINNIGFVNSSIHRNVVLGLHRDADPEARPALVAKLLEQIEWATKFVIKGKKFLGAQFTVADIYLYIVLTWAGFLGIALPADAQTYFNGIQAMEGVGSTYAAINKE